MLEADGLAVLRAAKASDSLCSVILMTGFGSLSGALDAVRAGAFDYISKPFKLEDLLSLIARAWKHTAEIRSGAGRRSSALTEGSGARVFVGKSAPMVELYKTVARASQSQVPLLISGERGSGKHAVAEAIHENGLSAGKRVFWIDGATAEKKNFESIRASEIGAVVVDDVAQLSTEHQLALLRLIEKETVRVIAITSADLEVAVDLGRFRRDLLDRLGVVKIQVPPLRERMEDLEDLVSHFIARHSEKAKKRISHVSEEALLKLRQREWPGNLRELENSLARAVTLAGTEVLYPEDFPDAPTPASTPGLPVGSAGSLEELERAHIVRVLQEVGFNKSRASEILGIDRATLYRKAQRYGIELKGPKE
jgi:DNA-binding NtrC family response regulator